jgi:hypothetical protein
VGREVIWNTGSVIEYEAQTAIIPFISLKI